MDFLRGLASDTAAELIILAATAALGIAAKRGFGDPLGRMHWPTAWVCTCILVGAVAVLAPRWFVAAYVAALVLGAVSLWRIGAATRKKAQERADQAAYQADWESRRQSAIREVIHRYNLSLYEPDKAAYHLERMANVSAILAEAWAHPHEARSGSQLMNAHQTLTNAGKGLPGSVSSDRLHHAVLDIARLANLEVLVLHRSRGAPDRVPPEAPSPAP